MARVIDWQKYPERTCCSMHTCAVCEKHITCGQRYKDGGYNRRAHVKCVEQHADIPEWPASLAGLGTKALINKMSAVRDGLKKIIRHNAVVYNGRSDEAGDMRRMAKQLLALLEE